MFRKLAFDEGVLCHAKDMIGFNYTIDVIINFVDKGM